MTLLEKAKSIKLNRKFRIDFNEEELELVLAWFNGEITTKQASGVLFNNYRSPGQVYSRSMSILRKARAENKIEVKKIT